MKVKERMSGSLPGYLTVKEAAAMLKISEGALYSRLYRSPYKATKVGRTLLLPVDTVLALFTETRPYGHDRQ